MIRFDDITKRRIVLGVAVIVVALVSYGLGRSGKEAPPGGSLKEMTSVSPVEAPSASPVPTGPTAIPPRPKAMSSPVPAAMPRIQFSKCVASPASLALKLGSTFILENLDTTSRKISMDVQIFNILPQSAATATALPYGTHSIICDGVAVGTLFVQP